MINFQNNVAFQ